MSDESGSEPAEPAAPSGPAEQDGVVGRPKRGYPRTFRGLIAAMIVTLAVVLGFWAITQGWAGMLREERTPDGATSAEWKPGVESAQSSAGDIGFDVVYPRSLPEGWYANTEPRYTGGEEPSWQLGFVRGESQYVGILQTAAEEFDAVQAQVDADAEKGDPVTFPTEVGDRWNTWTDAEGDHAYTGRVDGMTLMVWGPDEDDVRTYLELLTTQPLE